MATIVLISFLAGILTVLAPCVLPVLPVILGGSLQTPDPKRPLVIALSLGTSVVLFTLLLKASTLLVQIPSLFWQVFSGGIILFFGIITLFPEIWENISQRLGFSNSSQELLQSANQRKGLWGMVLLGAALGPVFASCSPVYFVILATVLPQDLFTGIIALIAYGLGLAFVLFLIGFFGQKLIAHLRWAANPRGWFRKLLGILLILIGVLIITGLEKKLELWLLEHSPLNATRIEEQFIPLITEDTEKKTLEESSSINVPTGFPFTENYQAPELAGLTNWINSPGFSSIKELEGKVVLIDFWTYSCINCIRTLPYIQALHEQYAADGLVIIGVHAPEFAFEREKANVEKAVKNFGLSYPIAQDNDFKTWRNFNNHYWPAKYLIDKNGVVRYTHFGEGDYEETEQAITALLETPQKDMDVTLKAVDFSKIRSPETYLGTARREHMVSADTQNLQLNQWKITGAFTENEESIILNNFPASIFMNFSASQANLVMGGNATAEIYIDGSLSETIQIQEEKLYTVADFQNVYGNHLIEIRFTEGSNATLYAWTFG